MPPQQQNQYEFITNPSRPASAGPAFLQDPKKRNIAVVVFVVVMLFIIIIAFSIITSIGKGGSAATVDVAAYQTELLRVSTLGLEEATDSSVRAEVSTMQAFINSDLSSTTAYLASNGSKLSPQEAIKFKSPTTEAELQKAAERNTYDNELLSTIDQISSDYKISLQKAIDSSSSESETEILELAAQNILTYEGL